ncbi:MAG: DUF3488 domain-containing transglutaminase family protein [Vitreoscilla sp.]|nr:DUF3488 domain-containing transglutaminase family protein [Vitreoscilla sp.]
MAAPTVRRPCRCSQNGSDAVNRLPTWAALRPPSRESRDTLFMLAVIAWTVTPHLFRLSPWVAVLCGTVLWWRAMLAWRQAPLPGRWALVGVLLVAVGLTFWSERTLLGRGAGVTLLVVLMALKTLELRARRDALVVFFLGFFLVLTQFLYSQSLWTALAMGLSVWGWLTALTLAHMPAGRPLLREAAALAGRAALVGTPVMVALFLLFPRLGPLWSMPGAHARTGLSDSLQLGDVAELATDDSIAFRLRFDGPVPPPGRLYFRGPVLSDYDGQRWRAPPLPRWPAAFSGQPPPGPVDSAGAIRYEMTLEPLRVPWLPLLEWTQAPPTIDPPLAGLPQRPDDDGQWRLRSPLGERIRLSAVADMRAAPAAELRPAEQAQLTALPLGSHPRTRAWARALQEDPALARADAAGLSQAVLRHIRREPFQYTLSPGTYEGDTVDEFWLDRRAGFCEHYAAAYVVVMRALGVPARIVTGYQGSDAAPVDGYHAVRQSHAHAWAEFWRPGQGWQRADPTGAVSPERIDRSVALASPPGLVANALSAVNPGLQLRLRRWAESLDNRWNQWVLGYGRRQQFDLLGQAGFASPDLLSLLRVLVGLVVAAGLAGAAWAWIDARRQTPWQRLRQGIAGELRRLGIDSRDSDTLASQARRLVERHGATGQPAADALLSLERHRYGWPGHSDPPRGWWRGFRRALAPARGRP